MPCWCAISTSWLEIRTLPEAFVDAEISDREIAPVDRDAHIGERHDLYRIHTEVAEIGHDVAGAVEIAPSSATLIS